MDYNYHPVEDGEPWYKADDVWACIEKGIISVRMEEVVSEQAKGEKNTMANYETINITLKNRHTAVWEASKGEWDDYAYDGKMFIIKKEGSWVGLYNMDSVICVVVK